MNEITRALNDEVVNLSAFSSDYGLYFSEAPVHGMRIAMVLGPLPFAVPAPDATAATGDGLARLLCDAPAPTPAAVLAMCAR
jgi:hypothetical protein